MIHKEGNIVQYSHRLKLVWLIRMCLNERYSEVHTSKYLPDKFPIHNGRKQRDALTPLLLTL
jgi:hypothetical protein